MGESPYIRLLREQRSLIGFGFAMALASSFGQTYFIGVFGQRIQAEFDLSHTGWGTVYMIGTLASAAVLPWSGKLIDRVPLRRYAITVALVLAVACAAMSLIVGVVTLVVAIFLLRQAGQGLSSHVAVTTMARYFDRDRGRAIAVATLGFSAGEAMFPVAAVAAIGVFGWRMTYAGLAVLVVAALVPIIALTLREPPTIEDDRKRTSADPLPRRSWTRAEVLRDPRFYMILPGVVAPALVVTALFFHHLNLADAKGWSHAWITGNYAVFAGSGTLVALVCGPMIDRLGATRLVPLMLVPMIGSLLVVAGADARWAVWPYLGLLGVSIGIAHTAVAAMWAELYGVEHIGAVRSMVTALAVFSSALGPVALGALMDSGLTIERSLLFFAAYAAAGTSLMMVALRRSKREPF